MPIKTNAAVGWRNPRVDSSLSEPLAYLISNTSMYKFNYWSIPLSHETMDIRFFMFDCVQSNYMPDNNVYVGPSYKQAFMANDVYNGANANNNVNKKWFARLVRPSRLINNNTTEASKNSTMKTTRLNLETTKSTMTPKQIAPTVETSASSTKTATTSSTTASSTIVAIQKTATVIATSSIPITSKTANATKTL